MADEKLSKPMGKKDVEKLVDNRLAASKTRKKAKRGFSLGLAGVLVVLVAATASAAVIVKNNINNPNNKIRDAIVSTLSLDSAAFSGTLSLTPEESLGAVDIEFEGAGNIGGSAKLNASVDIGLLGNIGFEFMSLDNTGYVKLEGAPLLLSLIGLGPSGDDALSVLDSTWFVLESGTEGLPGLDALPEEVSSAAADELKTIYDNHLFLEIEEQLGDETIEGQSSSHYRVAVDKEKLFEFLEEASENDIGRIDSVAEQLDNIDYDNLQLELWVGNETGYITKILASSTGAGQEFSLLATLSGFNNPVEVVVPEGAQSFEDALPLLLGPLLESSLDFSSDEITL